MQCESTGKTSFAHKRDALIFIKLRKHEVQLRAYPCGYCNGWHVTKKVENWELVPRELLNLPIQHATDFKKYLDHGTD